MLTNKGILCRKSDTVSCPVEIICSGVGCSRMFLALLLGINGKAMKLIVSLKIGNFITIALSVGFLCQLDRGGDCSAMLRPHRMRCSSHFGLHSDSQHVLAGVLGRYFQAGSTLHPSLVEIEAVLPAFVTADRLGAFSIALSSLSPSMICEPKHSICHRPAISPILPMVLKTAKLPVLAT
jgi:hypothetical protein